MPLSLDIGRLMSASVETNERMTAMELRLTRQMQDLSSTVTDQLDSFTSKMESIWRESIVFPKILDDHGATLRGHDVRISALEARSHTP